MHESIDDYPNRFRRLKASWLTQVSEHELVKMVIRGLDYSIRKKLDTQYLRDMAQLEDRVWQVEHLKAEKARSSKYHKKENVSYVETYEIDSLSDTNNDYFEENKVNVVELKSGAPYVGKLLKPSNGKNPIEPKNEKFVTKTYTFNVTKCDEILYLLVSEGHMVIPKGLKTMSLE